MGTFHDTRDPLHGITVAAVMGDTVTVGRCHERTAGSVVLVDADQHTEGEGGKTNAEYLSRAARFGVWKKHDRLELDAAALTSLAPLKDYFSSTGGTVVPKESAPPPPEAGTAEPQTESSSPVSLTPAAVAEVARLLAAEEKPDHGLRLGVAGGGCSGLTYQLEFTPRREGDLVISQDGFSIFLDRKSVIYLRGVSLDFEKGLGGKGFRFGNPNATNTCGCGESFAV